MTNAVELQHAAQDRPFSFRPLAHAGLALLVVVACSWVLAPASPHRTPRTPDAAAVQRLKQELAERRPAVLLLGNSILDEAVDEAGLQQQTGTSLMKLAPPGSASAVWFILMKNVIAVSDFDPPDAGRPLRVMIFFRDAFLTDPAFRTTGAEKRHQLDPYTTADEPLLDELAYEQQMNVLEFYLLSRWNLYQQREAARTGLQSAVMNAVSRDAGGAFGRVFDDTNLDPQQVTALQLAAEADRDDSLRPFAEQLPRSFLPHMVQLAHAANISLTFVRMPRRLPAQGHPDGARKLAYIADLREWLAANDCRFVDFSADPRLTLAHFGGGDHLSRDSGRPVFTQMLAEYMANAE